LNTERLKGYLLNVIAAYPVILVFQAQSEVAKNPEPEPQVTREAVSVKDAARRQPGAGVSVGT